MWYVPVDVYEEFRVACTTWFCYGIGVFREYAVLTTAYFRMVEVNMYVKIRWKHFTRRLFIRYSKNAGPHQMSGTKQACFRIL